MDIAIYIKFVLVLILVIGMILGLAWLLKRFGLADGARVLGRRRRLIMVESVSIDGRHRAALIRRDDVEHLVLVGPNTSQVIETGIPAAPLPDGAGPQSPAFSQFLASMKPGDKA